MFLPLILLFLIFGPCQSHQANPNCVPMCSFESYRNPPIRGGPPCMCRPEAFPSGCQLSPCGPNDRSDGDYTCQCTSFFAPKQCVLLRCDNGTTSYAAIYSSCPQHSVPPGSYPTPSYPSLGYQSTSTCSNYCHCYGDQPRDCVKTDLGPLKGGENCACNLNGWPTGCTLKQCEADDFASCECTPEFNGFSCYGARCTVS